MIERPSASTMTASQINRELDALDKKMSKINDRFIEAGRGHERPSETMQKDDPLAREWQAVSARRHELRLEIQRRYGPGAPSRLPRGFGPIREATDDWRDALVPGDDQYVPAVVLPQMPDVVARALAAGAQPPLEYIGDGMTGVVFCVGDVAYKVARHTSPSNHASFEDEAEWLITASYVRDVAPYVAQIHHFDADNLVIERDCVRPDPDRTPYRYGEGKLFDLHRNIERAMLPHGWSAPEFKLDSYVITLGGPVLVDAGMASRVGSELARYVEAVVSGERPLWNTTPSDLAFYVRREIGQTLSQGQGDRLEAMIERRWPSESRGMREASVPSEAQILDYFIFDAEDVDVGRFSRAKTDEVAAHFGIDPKAAYRILNALASRGILSKTRDVMRRHQGRTAVGFQWWEYVWRPGDVERFESQR